MNIDTLKGKNIIVYDLEIKKPIQECAKGWQGFDEMGISVGCAFDYRDMQYRVFMDDNLPNLVMRLREPNTLIVGFNHVEFDNKLLYENSFITFGGQRTQPPETLNYDMLAVSREGAGVARFTTGFKLQDHLLACNLPVKSGDGALAPTLWKMGKIGELIDYCLNDVHVERALFEHMVTTEMVACAHRPTPYSVRLPDFTHC